MDTLTPAQQFDRDLFDALEANLFHAKGAWDRSVLAGFSERKRVSKKGSRSTTIFQTRSTVTGNRAFLVSAGNASYLYGDRETVRTAFERRGLPDNPKRYIEGGEETREDGTRVICHPASARNTSSQYAAWVAEETGQSVDWGYGPTGEEAPEIDEVLARDVGDQKRPTKEEGEAVARRVTERIREETGLGFVVVEYRGSYFSEGYSVRSGQACYGGAEFFDDEETVYKKCLAVVEAHRFSIEIYGSPETAKGSTGEPYFAEQG